MQRLLDQLTQTPAIVLGRRMDILAWNSIAAALYTDFGQVPAAGRNYIRLLFTDRVIRGMHQQWEHDARDAVAALRMEAARDPDDSELAQLVGDLSVQARLPHLVGRAPCQQRELRNQALPSPDRR